MTAPDQSGRAVGADLVATVFAAGRDLSASQVAAGAAKRVRLWV